jgi:phage shock protein E
MNPSLSDALNPPQQAMRRSRRRAALALTMIGSLALAACGGAAEGPAVEAAAGDAPTASVATATARPDFGLISTAAAAQLAVDPEVVVIDVRTPEEFAEGHIEGATLIDINSPTFGDEIDALDRDVNYLVYCRSDNRSGQAVAIMQQLGFEQLWDMDGGVVVWSAEGRPLVR